MAIALDEMVLEFKRALSDEDESAGTGVLDDDKEDEEFDEEDEDDLGADDMDDLDEDDEEEGEEPNENMPQE